MSAVEKNGCATRTVARRCGVVDGEGDVFSANIRHQVEFPGWLLLYIYYIYYLSIRSILNICMIFAVKGCKTGANVLFCMGL
jgi:hypothetical protein